jgi:hypothetical protein
VGAGVDVCLAKFDPSGTHMWSRRFGDTMVDPTTQAGTDVVADPWGNAILAGGFFGSIDFGDGPLVSAGESDTFLARLVPCDDPTSIRAVPNMLTLFQNVPNPFNPSTRISFSLPVRTKACLSIYDVHGKLVRTLVDDVLDKGLNERTWDGKDFRGNSVSSGVYFYRLNSGDRTLTKKMILLK